MGFFDRLQNGWNAFLGRDPTKTTKEIIGPSFSRRPDITRISMRAARAKIAPIYTRIAIDVAAINIRHAYLNEDDQYLDDVPSGLNDCLRVSANLDQTGRAFMQDVVTSLCDEGVIAIVPIDTNVNPYNGSYDIRSLRVGKIVSWYASHVKVNLYDERTGEHKDLIMPKRIVSIVENPLYAVMNERNSTLQRLMRKIAMLDAIDEQTSSGKLDLIIQLPYVIKTELQRTQAENRRKEIENQLNGSKYGIAYTDGTERIVQLNRAIENNLQGQIEALKTELYSQLGVTKEVFEGTADDKVMLNYYNRTIEPILSAIADEMKRKFLTKTAITQGQSIYFFRDPFKLSNLTDLAEAGDKFTRNEIMTSNEIRGKMGLRPSNSPDADELRNKNLNKANNPPEQSDEQEDYDEENHDQDNYEDEGYEE